MRRIRVDVSDANLDMQLLLQSLGFAVEWVRNTRRRGCHYVFHWRAERPAGRFEPVNRVARLRFGR